MQGFELTYEEFEFPFESESALEAGELDELAAELLSVTSEAELDLFLGKMFKKVGRFVGKAMKPLGKVLKGVASVALPIAGKLAGSFFGGPLGGMIGGQLGSLAGKAVGNLEAEGVHYEEREFEAAKRFVEFAKLASSKYAKAPPSGSDDAAALKAAKQAAAELAAKRAPSVKASTGSVWAPMDKRAVDARKQGGLAARSSNGVWSPPSAAYTPEQGGGAGLTSSDGGSSRPGVDGGPHPEAFLRVAPVQLAGVTLTAEWLQKTLYGVIANRGASKRWNDLLELDGGTVGIAHFAKGGLRTLHRTMDAQRYFGRGADSIRDNPHGDASWREGMRRFFASPESHATQVRAWVSVVDGALVAAAQHGWRAPRALAIAAGVANSLGAGGFQRNAQANGWDPERTLQAYASMSAHKARRAAYIDREFPR